MSPELDAFDPAQQKSLTLDLSRLSELDAAGAPARTLEDMATFLALPLGAEDRDAVVATKIRAAEARLKSGVGEDAGAGPDREGMVIAKSGQIRAFDAETGFQSRHISDYRDGGWRKAFDTAQKARLETALGPWLAANGYA